MTNARIPFLALASLSLLALAACGDDPAPADDGSSSSTSSAAMEESPFPDEPTGPITADRASKESVAAAILESFARGDWPMLASFVAPTGVRFTPYTHVNVETDQTLLPADIAGFGTDLTIRTWGTEEGSGFPIELTNADYAKRYVWDHDYRSAPEVLWNQKLERGGMVDNVQEVYPGATVVEYHFPGFEAQFEGMDWRSLRLVMAQGDDGNWVLYGVIHDEWTP